MDDSKFIVANQKEESISIQRVKVKWLCCITDQSIDIKYKRQGDKCIQNARLLSW